MTLPAVTRSEWAERINARWQTSHTAILETGHIVAAAKDALEKEEFEAMLATDLRCGASTARRLIIIAADQRLSDRAHVHKLPNHWGTLYELTKLDDETFGEKIADGTINPQTERGDVVRLRKATKVEERRLPVDDGGTIADLHDLVEQGRTFATFYVDPPYDYETWSDKGADRSPSQHYDTMTLDEIADVPIGELAADNSILHLWVISTLVPAASELIKGWGFTYKKVGFIWTKTVADGSAPKMGNGKWTRDEAEVCLLATRGHPTRLDAGVRQTLSAPLGEHSEKPDEFRERITRLTAGPYLELFGRKEVAGWLVWGNQVRWRINPVPDGTDNPGGDHVATPPKTATSLGTTGAGDGGPIADAVSPASADRDLPTFLRLGHPDNAWRGTR